MPSRCFSSQHPSDARPVAPPSDRMASAQVRDGGPYSDPISVNLDPDGAMLVPILAARSINASSGYRLMISKTDIVHFFKVILYLNHSFIRTFLKTPGHFRENTESK